MRLPLSHNRPHHSYSESRKNAYICSNKTSTEPMDTRRNYFQPLASLQLFAIIAVVMGHLWVDDANMMNSLCVSFCFVYSGFFTAMFHRFDNSYGLKDHARFMWNKLAKLYPLFVLSLIINYVSMVVWDGIIGLSPSVLLGHLTMLNTWIPDSHYYFGYNAVAWFVCDLFFLYLMAPLVVRLLRRLAIAWQVVMLIALLILELVGGYTHDLQSESKFLSFYHLYLFPPIRLLDFAAGIIIYNITTTAGWKRLQARLTPARSTCVEAAGVLLFAALYWIEKNYWFEHCFRAFCVHAPAVVALFTPFVLTSNRPGLISRLLSMQPLPVLSQIGFEIYILQIVIFFLFKPLCVMAGVDQHPVLYFMVQNTILVITAWLIHRYYVKPLDQRLKALPKSF